MAGEARRARRATGSRPRRTPPRRRLHGGGKTAQLDPRRSSLHELHEWEEDAAVTSDYGAGKLLITGEDARAIEEACERLGLRGLVEPRTDTEIEPAVLIDADLF